MIGLTSPATLSRRTQTGQKPNGTPLYATTVVWSGRVSVQNLQGSSRYEPAGQTAVGMFCVFMPVGASPRIGDLLAARGSTFEVEFVKEDQIGHHLEVMCRRVSH